MKMIQATKALKKIGSEGEKQNVQFQIQEEEREEKFRELTAEFSDLEHEVQDKFSKFIEEFDQKNEG